MVVELLVRIVKPPGRLVLLVWLRRRSSSDEVLCRHIRAIEQRLWCGANTHGLWESNTHRVHMGRNR